jgi:proline racemase
MSAVILEADAVPCVLDDDEAQALVSAGVIYQCELHEGSHYHINEDFDWEDVSFILKLHDCQRVIH